MSPEVILELDPIGIGEVISEVIIGENRPVGAWRLNTRQNLRNGILN